MRATVVLAIAAAGSLMVAGSARTAASSTKPRCTIRGTDAADVLVGTSRSDVICGEGGRDLIRAGGGSDVVYTEGSSDVVYLGGGNDRAYTRAGADTVYAGPGTDHVYAGADDDTLFARNGDRDLLDGGPGHDRALADRDRIRRVEELFPAPSRDPVLVAAGDISSCASIGDERTAVLLDAFPTAVVATLGDNTYPDGTPQEYAKCYGPTWGRAKARTRPVPGGNEYHTAGAAAYFDYFGGAAGEREKGYYSYNLGSWHVVALNSNCAKVGGCREDSPQVQWLRADLAASGARCTLAYWHHPRFSSAKPQSSLTRQFWAVLYEFGADVVLNGDDHLYERFSPQTPDGGADVARGIRQFTVGTGGKSHTHSTSDAANSEVRNDDTYGVLTLRLAAASYRWQFVPTAQRRFTDRGSTPCH